MSILALHEPLPGVLVTPGGVPIPPPSVVRRLAEISPRLSVEWIAGAWKPYWGLKIRWAQGDPRWEWVQTKRIPESAAFDLEQMFPDDCTTEDMVAYVEQRWGDRAHSSNASAEAESAVIASHLQTTAAREEQIQATVTKGQERYLSESDHARRVRAGVESAHPMVPGGLTT